MKNKKKLTIIILSAAPNSKATKSIIAAGEARGHTMKVYNPAHLYLLISNKVRGYDRIYESLPEYDAPVRINALECDAVISRIGSNLEYGSAVLEHFNNNLGIFCTQSAMGIKTAANKLMSLQKLSQNKVRVPKTVIGDNILHVRWLIEQVGNLPAIAKTLQGSQGVGVFPLMEPLQTNAMIESFYKTKTKLIIQEYIDAGMKDIRAIVIDGKVIVAMERTARKGDLRSNISLGGSGKKIELSEEDKELCINAADAVGLRGAAGVDIIKSNDGTSFCIEVNGNYGYKIEKVTNTDISTPLIEFCERNYKKGSVATPTLAFHSERQLMFHFLSAIYAGLNMARHNEQEIENFKRRIRFALTDLRIDENYLLEVANDLYKKMLNPE